MSLRATLGRTLSRFPRLRGVLKLLRGRGSRARNGLSVGIGLFIGCLPLYGLHFPLCAAICVPLGLDTLLAYLAANVSNPIFLPFILLAEVELGSRLLHGTSAEFTLEAARRLGALGFGSEVAVGSLVFGGALGMIGGLLTAHLSPKREASPLESALLRTQARYARATPGDRHYVRMKLALDPVVEQLYAFIQRAGHAGFGRVLDAGCGRGQLGLLLLELGCVLELRGFDFDARKVGVAQLAAAGQAEFRVGDVNEAAFEGYDSVLLIDVLHYLSQPEQDSVLARVAAALQPGGRLLLRETDSSHSLRSALTRGLEYIATRIGYNRSARRLSFRSLSSLQQVLEAHGLRCTRLEDPAMGSARLSNALLLAERPIAAD